MTIQEIKDKIGKTSEFIFDIPAQPYASCDDINKSVKDLKGLVDDIVENREDEKDVVFYARMLRGDIEDSLEARRSQIENVRAWGQEWKDLAKRLFDELTSVDEETAMRYVSSKAEEMLE